MISDKTTCRAGRVHYLHIKVIITYLRVHACTQATDVFMQSHAKAYVSCVLHMFDTLVALNLLLVCTVCIYMHTDN